MEINGIDSTNSNGGKQNVQNSGSIKTNNAKPSVFMEGNDWAHKVVQDVENKMKPEEIDKKNIDTLKNFSEIGENIRYENNMFQTFFYWQENGEQICELHISNTTDEPIYRINDYDYTSDNPKYKEVKKLFSNLLKNATPRN